MSLAEVAGEVVVGAVALVALGIVVYVAVSFVIMRSHTEPRPLGSVLREAARELAWASLTQPLLPIGYILGRRLGGGGPSSLRSSGQAPSSLVPVVLVHGYSQNRVNFLRLARELTRAGVGPLYGFNYPWLLDVPSIARRLDRFVDRVRRETGAERVDLVCHALGGLVAIEYLSAAGAVRVRRCVTIATPHGGVPWRGFILGACAPQLRIGSEFLLAHSARPIPVPCLSIYSTHDNIVHPAATCSLAHRGGRDVVVPNIAHLSILFSRPVAIEVIRFLTTQRQ